MAEVTCHTDACGNKEVPIEMDLSFRDDQGQVHQITNVVCGVCGQPITDIKR